MWLSVAFLVSTIGLSVGQTALQKEQLYRLGYANNNFAINLHRKLVEEGDGNVFFSPFSVSSVLAMLYNGARGTTYEELRKVLGYRKFNDSTIFSAFRYYLSEVIDKMDPKICTINSVSAMIIDKAFPVLPEYKTEMQDIFQAFVEDVNVSEENVLVVDRMNTWAKIKTKGNVVKLAEYIDPETTLFLASAAYFKGSWKLKFNPDDTKPHPFYNWGDPTNASDVPMMHAHVFTRYFEDEDENFTAIELGYEGKDASMVIFLPNEYDGIGDLEKNLTATRMQYVRRGMYFVKVHLTVPRFKLQTDNSLSKPLKELGFKRMFSFGADLSGMLAEGSNLKLDEIRHRAMIDVNEKGSVASAVTRAVMMKSMPLRIPDPEFKVNHPFLFGIFDIRNSMILFMGRVSHFCKDTAA